LLSVPDKPKDELQQHYLEGLRLKFRHGGLQALTRQEKRELLLDAKALQALAEPRTLVESAAAQP
ncbi:MAG TPA: hypothetical protein VNZ22_13510, partial [Bacillota bacterium]|nr:hypothetical protein [Bacillota bacterium]